MKELLEQGFGMVLIGSVAGIGVLARMILWRYYRKLVKACREFGKTKNKTVAYIREDINRRWQCGLGMKNTLVYTECRLSECKTAGLRLGVLEGISEQSLILVLLSGGLFALAGVVWGCEVKDILFHLFFGGMTLLGLLLLELFAGLKEKHKRVRMTIRDYIENGIVTGSSYKLQTQEPPKAEKEEKKKSVSVSKKKERTSRVKSKKVRMKKHGKAQEEKRRLTEELLRDRRQLEARRAVELKSAEQKKEPVTEEVFTKEAVEEAAVTEFSYESLLSEVLAEYLA